MGYNSFDFANSVETSLIGNIGTLQVSNTTLNLWTDSTTAVTKAWQQGDPNSDISKKIAGLSSSAEINDFLNNYLNSANIDNFSSANIQALLSKIGANYDKDAGPIQMSEVQSFGNLISSTQQIQTSTGDSESKTQGGFLTQLTSSQQSEEQMFPDVAALMGAAASLSV